MDEKVKDLCNHILEECENRGFTIAEVNFLSGNIGQYLREAVGAQSRDTLFQIN